MQGDTTPANEIQVIDGEIKHWCVKSEMLKSDETFQQWWVRKQEEVNYRIEKIRESDPDYVGAGGIYFYDAQPLASVTDIEGKLHCSMIVRYDWIKQ